MSTLAYYDEAGLSAAFYDITTNAFPMPGDIAFYAGLAGSPGASVLELGCGTGRVTLALAERGYAVTGVDLAASMLFRAKLKCEAAPPAVARRIELRQGDMAALDLGRAFDAVLVPFFGFSHLPDARTRARALRVIARHLEAGGAAAIHGPSLAMLRQPLGEEEMSGPYNAAGDRVRIRIVERAFDDATARARTVVEYTLLDPAGAETRRSREELVLHWFEPDEIAATAAACGLRLERTLTDFEGTGAERALILVLRREADAPA